MLVGWLAHLKGLLQVGRSVVPPVDLLSPSLGRCIMEEWVVEWWVGGWVVEWRVGTALEYPAVLEMEEEICQGKGEGLWVGTAS